MDKEQNNKVYSDSVLTFLFHYVLQLLDRIIECDGTVQTMLDISKLGLGLLPTEVSDKVFVILHNSLVYLYSV